MLWILLKHKSSAKGKKGLSGRAQCALLGTEVPVDHPGSEELTNPHDFCMSQPRTLQVAAPGQHEQHRCHQGLRDQHRRWVVGQTTRQTAGQAAVALSSLLLLRVFRQISGKFCRGEAHDLVWSLCPRQSPPFCFCGNEAVQVFQGEKEKYETV